MVSTVTSQKEGCRFEPAGWLGSFCVKFACSLCVAVVSYVSPQPKDMQVRLIIDSKLPVGVNGSMNGCSVINWSRVYPTSRPMSAGIGSSPPDCEQDKLLHIMDGWIDNTDMHLFCTIMSISTFDTSNPIVLIIDLKHRTCTVIEYFHTVTLFVGDCLT